MTTHACPDCGASHRRKAPTKKRPAPRNDPFTDLDPTACPRCSAPVLDGRIAGLDLILDPRPLNEIGWLTYRATGRRIVIRSGARADTITPSHRWPPAKRTWFHIEHSCDSPVPAALVENCVTEKERTVDFPDIPNY